MTNFILLHILTGALVGAGLVLFILSFSHRARENNAEWTIRLLGFSLLASSILSVAALSEYSKCPNCDIWTDSTYCQECGTEVNPEITCPGCKKEFYIEAVPAFCPDCGTKVKE
ncbi:MAG: hypothetical protein IJZ42_01640 [Lachnospiraceae bacterium]|nr:hypothetical protein [Lachnospiraceae bacterium]